MEYTNRFADLSGFATEYVTTNCVNMQSFEGGLASYIQNQLVGQHVQSSQELYKHAAEIKRVKSELRMANQANPKKRWNEKSNQAEGFPNTKPTNIKLKP